MAPMEFIHEHQAKDSFVRLLHWNRLTKCVLRPTDEVADLQLKGPNCGGLSSTGRVCPFGRRMGVPEITTDEALPWYPTGMYFQLGSKGSAALRNMQPTLVACSSEE
ncbi:hypothetical protein TYRP_019085 [Tyrophagus putrescentiae]|nr:hypothetical protein TYRP_019085 [Tyrophagus putrescentiae]